MKIVEHREEFNQTGRTIEQLLEDASKEEKKAERILKEQAEAQRIQELQNLAKREVQAWEEVNSLLEKPQAKTYDQCVKLLIKLRDLAIYQNRYSAFQERINQIYQKYSRRTGLIKRLRDASL